MLTIDKKEAKQSLKELERLNKKASLKFSVYLNNNMWNEFLEWKKKNGKE